MNTSSSNNPQILRLKRALFTLFVLLAAFASAIEATAGSIGPALHARLLSASPQETVPVIVQMADRVDLHRYRGMEKRQAQRSLVADLKSLADNAQGPVIAFLNRAGIHGTRQLWINNSLALYVPPSTVETLATLPGVEEVRLDATIQAPTVTLAAPTAPPEWNIDAIGAPVLWNMPTSFTGQGVVVATFDTGVDIDHPDIGSKWRGGSNSWFDPYTPSTIPYDGAGDGHGTATMGLIVGGESSGTTIGVAPDAQWIAAKIFADDGSAPFTAIHEAFQWALDPDGIPGNGDEPEIVNHSWGLQNTDTCETEFDPDIDALKAAGIAVVFSAGNAGPNPATSISPGNNTGSLAVGMTDEFDLIHDQSSRGPSPCDGPGLPYPELVAPGVAVRTADRTLGGTSPNPYLIATGTSFSAPHVSGAMALLLSAFPSATVADLEAALIQSARDLGAIGPDDVYGHGRLDVAAAFDVLALPNLEVHDPVAPENDRLLPFGSVAPGSSSERILTLKNVGGITLDISTVGDGLAAPFTVEAALCEGQSLAPGDSCSVPVRFSPPTFSVFVATLDIVSTDSTEPVVSVALSGSGNNPPAAATLFSPADGTTGLDTDVTFQWLSPVDPDGDPVSDLLLLSKTENFSSSTPIVVALAPPAVLVAGVGGLMLLCSLLPLCRRRGHRLICAALVSVILALFLSCGGGSSGTSAVTSPNASHTVTGLDPATTYFWKIVSDDGRGGSAESTAWQFTTR